MAERISTVLKVEFYLDHIFMKVTYPESSAAKSAIKLDYT
jgi:hypothetical protein